MRSSAYSPSSDTSVNASSDSGVHVPPLLALRVDAEDAVDDPLDGAEQAVAGRGAVVAGAEHGRHVPTERPHRDGEQEHERERPGGCSATTSEALREDEDGERGSTSAPTASASPIQLSYDGGGDHAVTVAVGVAVADASVRRPSTERRSSAPMMRSHHAT